MEYRVDKSRAGVDTRPAADREGVDVKLRTGLIAAAALLAVGLAACDTQPADFQPTFDTGALPTFDPGSVPTVDPASLPTIDPASLATIDPGPAPTVDPASLGPTYPVACTAMG